MKYDLLSRILHATMAILIIGMLILGFTMDEDLYSLHKQIGVVILSLAIIRSLRRIQKGFLPSNQAARIVQLAMYGLMFAMPISGWLMSNSFGYPVSILGLQLPFLIGVDKSFGNVLAETHGILALCLIGLICLHLCGFIYHQFIKKDKLLDRVI
jgi:cytochrome b561